MKIFTFDPKKQKAVLAGEVLIDDSCFEYFYKKVKKNHFMIRERSYGISEDVLQQLVHLGITKIIIETKTKKIESNLEQWLDCPIKDYGSGKQRFLKVL
jgi:hypothetical protein